MSGFPDGADAGAGRRPRSRVPGRPSLTGLGTGQGVFRNEQGDHRRAGLHAARFRERTGCLVEPATARRDRPRMTVSPNAALVPADQDFGGCLELLKTTNTVKLRYTGDTHDPARLLPAYPRPGEGDERQPSRRSASRPGPGHAGGAHVAGVVETGPSVQLVAYGKVETVEAIVGTGSRTGVDMSWGTAAIFGHFGLDLTGAERRRRPHRRYRDRGCHLGLPARHDGLGRCARLRRDGRRRHR